MTATTPAHTTDELGAVLIANRGEIAIRIIRAVHESRRTAIAVYPADDADSLHVARADAAVQIPGVGPAAYLDIDAIIAAARHEQASAIHPGYGFLSENAEFARRCRAAGLTFIGPSAEVLDLFGDKAQARAYAIDRDVPVLPGTTGATSLEQVTSFAAQHGAVMIKALSGGGGRGIRAVTDPADLPGAYDQASSEAHQAFGSGEVYVEKLLKAPRHLEVQILGDGTGKVVALGERDCSIQRRHQKLIEAAPSPWLNDTLRSQITDCALRLAAGVDYCGLGTFEFLLSGDEFWFMEANPRVQVEHTVTEEVTGVDLVAAGLAVSTGARLADLGLTTAPLVRGQAIQVRLNAESLTADGTPMPSSGRLSGFDLPSGPGIRVDTGGYRGWRLSPRYDSLLAKIIVHGSDLEQVTMRLTGALEELHIDGVATNADLLHGIVTSEQFTQSPWDTGFLNGPILQTLLTHHRTNHAPTQTTTEATTTTEHRTEIPDGAVAIVSPSAGVVISLDIEPTDLVAAGQPVAIIEAMKMEHVLRAEEGTRIEAVLVAVGDAIDAGTVLAYGTGAEVSQPSSADTPLRDTDDWSPEIAEIERRRASGRAMGGPAKLERQHREGKLDARQRIDALADPGTFAEIGALAGFSSTDQQTDDPAAFTPANFIAGTAKLDGRKVMLGVDDFTLRGGSGDAAIHAKQIFAEEYANEMRLPVVRLLDGASGGGSVKMAIDAGYTYVPVNPGWDVVVDQLSVAPVVAAALGPTVGLGAGRLVMSHLAILVEGVGQMFTAGPPVVLGGTGEKLTKEELGGADIHRGTGAIERIVADEQTAFATIRKFLSYLPGNAFELPPVLSVSDPADRRDEALLGLVPRIQRRPYDLATLLDAVFDTGSVFPYAEYGGGTFTALARLDGHPVGVIAADPAQGATLSAQGSLAITRLVDLCQTFHLPIVSLTDQAGLTIGTAAERAATIRHGARAIAAVYQATVPQAEIIVRRVFGVGGAGIVNRHRPVRSWAWPSGDWGSLPSRGGIEAAYRAHLEAADDPAAELERLIDEMAGVTSIFRTAERFGVQDIIDPRDTRALLCDWVHDAYRLLPSQLGKPTFGTRP